MPTIIFAVVVNSLNITLRRTARTKSKPVAAVAASFNNFIFHRI